MKTLKNWIRAIAKFLWEGAVWILYVWKFALEDVQGPPQPPKSHEAKLVADRLQFAMWSFLGMLSVVYTWGWLGVGFFFVFSEVVYALMHISPPPRNTHTFR